MIRFLLTPTPCSWFAKGGKNRSWEVFIRLINEVVEMKGIVDRSPEEDQLRWDLNYHDGAHHPVYQLGRRSRSGWWKCGTMGKARLRFCSRCRLYHVLLYVDS